GNEEHNYHMEHLHSLLTTQPILRCHGKEKTGMIFVGTSGWQYASWRGRFYPKGVPQRAWLAHYANHFPVVEVNNSFYVLPKESTFDRWRQESPGRFLFVVKASRYITHIRRLRNAK